MNLNYQLTNSASYNTENWNNAGVFPQAPTPSIHWPTCGWVPLYPTSSPVTMEELSLLPKLIPMTHLLRDSTLFLSIGDIILELSLSKNKDILLHNNPAVNVLLHLLLLSLVSMNLCVCVYQFLKTHFFF